MIKKMLLITIVLALSACGNSISGEYIGQENSRVDKLIFGPGDEVRAVLGESIRVGTFTVVENKVNVIIGNDQNAMTIKDDGCLDGGYVGVYCK